MRRVALVVVILVIAVGGALLVSRGLPGTTPAPAPTGTLPPVPLAQDVTADASVVPVRSAELGVAAPGRVTFVAAEGARVAAGDELLGLDHSQADAVVAQAQAALVAAQAQATQAAAAGRQADEAVAVASAQVTQATAAWNQARAERDQLPSAARSAQKRAANAAVDAAAAGVTAAKAQVRVARQAAAAAHAAGTAATADAARAQASVDEAVAARADLQLVAPFAGVVAFAAPSIGENVSPGAPLIRLQDTTAWRIQTTDLDETAAARFDVGAAATITLDAFPGQSFDGIVREIRPYGETYQGNIVYQVLIEPTTPLPPNVRWNMTASVTIVAK